MRWIWGVVNSVAIKVGRSIFDNPLLQMVEIFHLLSMLNEWLKGQSAEQKGWRPKPLGQPHMPKTLWHDPRQVMVAVSRGGPRCRNGLSSIKTKGYSPVKKCPVTPQYCGDNYLLSLKTPRLVGSHGLPGHAPWWEDSGKWEIGGTVLMWPRAIFAWTRGK